MSPLVILQVRLVFKCLKTETGEREMRLLGKRERETHTHTHTQVKQTGELTLSHIWQANGLSLL